MSHLVRYAAGLCMAGYGALQLLGRQAGSTRQERGRALAGDAAVLHPHAVTDHAVTIGAPPEAVWPWLTQMGWHLGGYYTPRWVDRLMFRARYVEGRHSATRIHPELPALDVGDTVPMGAGVFAPVSEVEPYRHLVAQEAFVLRPLPGGKTRLIARYRGTGFVSPAARAVRPGAGPVPRLIRFAVLRIPGVNLAARALDFFIADPLHHYMETGMLTGIKARAEGKRSSWQPC